jgi:hypothetical protein
VLHLVALASDRFTDLVVGLAAVRRADGIDEGALVVLADDSATRLIEQDRQRAVVVPRAERDHDLAREEPLRPAGGVEVDAVDQCSEQRPGLGDARGEAITVGGGQAALAASRDEGRRELCHARILP